MLPSAGTDSVKIVRYTGEVGGRILGVAAMKNLVPDPARKAELVQSANAIIASAQALNTAQTTRTQFENLEQRITVGNGKGIDRGFDAVLAFSSESIRTSLPDRSYHNPEYRAIFPNGTEEYTSPTIREDEQIATDLRLTIENSNAPAKTEVLALIDEVLPVVAPAAKALSDGEKQVNALFQAEMNARKNVIDALWEQRKNVEKILGRQGKGLARFIFFDFRKTSESDTSEPVTPDPTTPPQDGA